MTIKEIISEVAGKESGWCICSTPDLQMVNHMDETLVEKIVERVIDRCAKEAESYPGNKSDTKAIAWAIRKLVSI